MEEFDKSISFDGRDIRLKIGLLALKLAVVF
jgi:hypothetical protein